jgi:hypothetical protein
LKGDVTTNLNERQLSGALIAVKNVISGVRYRPGRSMHPEELNVQDSFRNPSFEWQRDQQAPHTDCAVRYFAARS